MKNRKPDLDDGERHQVRILWAKGEEKKVFVDGVPARKKDADFLIKMMFHKGSVYSTKYGIYEFQQLQKCHPLRSNTKCKLCGKKATVNTCVPLCKECYTATETIKGNLYQKVKV